MGSKLPEVETITAFARRVECSRPYASRLIDRGLPVDDKGRVLVVEGLAWLEENVQRRRPTAARKASGAGLLAEKERLTRLQADLRELEIAERRGDFIKRDVAATATKALVRTMRDAVLNAPARHGSQIAAEVGCDPRRLTGALERMLRETLSEWADTATPFDRKGAPA